MIRACRSRAGAPKRGGGGWAVGRRSLLQKLHFTCCRGRRGGDSGQPPLRNLLQRWSTSCPCRRRRVGIEQNDCQGRPPCSNKCWGNPTKRAECKSKVVPYPISSGPNTMCWAARTCAPQSCSRYAVQKKTVAGHGIFILQPRADCWDGL